MQTLGSLEAGNVEKEELRDLGGRAARSRIDGHGREQRRVAR